ncbi:MAG: glutamine-hydrolyzing carbamoyl-phosphate synthase small subunit [Tannerella sp.]|jgi:carbamoyl-phosphate synthase small subunit|nr:glutamine-hydrolyzing carbamoyl-phosphate synthase small subunit [Tannerella sp.]
MSLTKATLILEDGSRYEGYSFGAERDAAGEVVFNTAMSGYPESLTDPSYAGQMMVLTYPLIGNYGAPVRTLLDNGVSRFMESERIHVEAMIISDYSYECSHWNAETTLSDWLRSENIPGLCGIDTRALTKRLRERGVMMGRIEVGSGETGGGVETDGFTPSEAVSNVSNVHASVYSSINYVNEVSCKEVITYNASPTRRKVVLVDCGVKHNIIRCLSKRDLTVIRVPWDYDFNTLDYDGLFISNGPGDPDTCDAAVQNIRRALDGTKPICGICMGNQLLAKAGGATIYKLKYGHRSHNQPVRQAGTNRCYITSQNHGYAVDNATLGADWEPLFINMNDGTNEGIRHRTKPFFSSQFHPEASSGPTDTEFIFDMFAEMVVKN